MVITPAVPDPQRLPERRFPASRVSSRHSEVWGARTRPVQPTPSQLTPSQQARGADGRYPERDRRP